MTGAWGVYRDGQRWGRSPRRAWLVLRAGGHDVVQFDGPVLELMTASRVRFDQRIAGLGPDILAADLDERRFLRAPARRRPDAADRRRAARPAHDRGHRQPVEVRGLLRRRRSIRGARPARSPTTRRCASCASRGRACSSPRATASRRAAPRSTAASGGRARAAARRSASRGQGDDNRTTYWCPGCQH